MALRLDGRRSAANPVKDWHPEDIKAAVRKLGISLEQLSRDAGLPEFACRTALRRPHYDGEMVIAEFLSLSPRQIWPSRFRPDGSRIPRTASRREPNAAPAEAHRQIGTAA